MVKACQVHDFMYEIGGDREDKIFADRLFLFNMISIVEKEDNLFDEPALYRAITYYIAVSRGGDSSFGNED